MRAKKFLACLAVIAVMLIAGSCKKLADVSKPTGPLAQEPIRFTDAIPREYGTLIAVTQNPTKAEWVALWFQQADGSVVAVPVNGVSGKFGDTVLRIPRK